jgi:hypothetical protein
MRRYLPAALTTHPALSVKHKEFFKDWLPGEFGPTTLDTLGQLLEAIILEAVPDLRREYADTWLENGRTLCLSELKPSYFTPEQVAAGRETIANCYDPGKLLTYYFSLRATGRKAALAIARANHNIITAAELARRQQAA